MKRYLNKVLESIRFIRSHDIRNLYIFNVQNSLYRFVLRLLGFRLRYFNGFHSENGQDRIILNYFGKSIEGAKNGIFIDVGANHPVKFSNSLFFEKNLGFSTIAVEPLTKFKALWKDMRPQAEFHNVAISSTRGFIEFTVFEGENNEDMFSGISIDAHKVQGKSSVISVETLPLSELLNNRQSEFSILSIDVEGAEVDVLKTIDFEKFSPTIILAENNDVLWGNEEVRQLIIGKGYTYLGRIWSLDDIFYKSSTPLSNL